MAVRSTGLSGRPGSRAGVVIGLLVIAFVLGACRSLPGETTPPRESIGVERRDRAKEAVAAFDEGMADPGVSYRMTGQLRVGERTKTVALTSS